MRYGLEYILIRTLENGKPVNLPISEFERILIKDYETTDYNEALQARTILCEGFKFGYVKIVELD